MSTKRFYDRPSATAEMALHGRAFANAQIRLNQFNRVRLLPGFAEEGWRGALAAQQEMLLMEGAFVEAARREIVPLVADVPDDADAFVDWFKQVGHAGPGQGDPLFPWLAHEASLEEMTWFLSQEVGGEAGFDDLVALTQVKMPTQAKLEMARNYWDEMGCGQEKGMHGGMLEHLAKVVGIAPEAETTVSESLALGNLMIALACNRRYAFHSVGALGAIEMTAPGRAECVNEGLRRLNIPKKASHYFALHAILDVRHFEAWAREILHPLVAADSRRARPIAEGAMLRLWCGQRCFERYRRRFGLESLTAPNVLAAE